MTKWLKRFWLTKPMAVMVTLIFAFSFVAGCSPTSPEPTSAPASFSYSVRVQAEDTSEPIPKAIVKIEVRGKATLDAITDSNGYARIFIDSSYAGQPGKLIVDATDYEICEKNIDLIEGSLPMIIQLQKSEAASLSPTLVMLPSGTITPPPTQPYPAPTLLNPASGATIVGEELINFSWQWDRDLQKGEKFDLRIWQPEKAMRTVALPYEHSFSLNTPPDGFGHYLWQVAVVRIDESGSKSTLSESEVWPFVWNSVLPTPTSTMTPTPTPEPDAVVRANALNLRSGPGAVYDILGVLKQGDHLEVTGRNPAGNWLEVICPDGKEGWVGAWLLEINLPLPGVAVAQVPPTPTPMYTPTPTAMPAPELFPPPISLEPENGACFLGEPVTFRWQWDRPRGPDEVFFLRVRREGETRLCHCDKAKDLEYRGSLSYCTAGTHYWSVVLVRDVAPWLPEEDVDRWQDLSEPSEERWFYYVPGDEPWTWPTPDSDEDGGPDEPSEAPD